VVEIKEAAIIIVAIIPEIIAEIILKIIVAKINFNIMPL